ncbi:MAG TPA: hypothetical protein VGI40_04805 [Pirellulaceae bacterium]
MAKPVIAQELPGEGPPLPLKRVVLFSSSVGYFEHRGEIEGRKQIEFAFKTSDINDLLKSLVVQDRDGGFVTAVNYGSPEPLNRTLRTFAIDLTENPTLAQIFQQLRGQSVQIEAPSMISGVVVGVESRRVTGADGGDRLLELLNVRTEQGLQSVRIDDISRTRFLDSKTDREFQQALDVVARAHADDQKRVKLDFSGDGKRQVSVGYIQEAAVWKTSYRLVLADDAQPFLQGWAIVENTTAQDWRDVQLTLISGRPISFLMDLYEPLYMARPFVRPEQHASLRPRVYEQDLGARTQEFEAAAAKAQSNRNRGAMGGMGGGMMGGMGGAGGGMSGGGMFGGGPRGRSQQPFVTTVVAADEDQSRIDLTKGVASAASGQDAGELFRYVITAPVTLNRSESAMLPIVNDAVKVEKVVIFNPAVHAKHPLSGLRLTNSTPLHLLQGPITLFDGGEYAGDARIEDIPPGSTRLISYALDLQTEVAIEQKPAEQTLVSLQIRKGGLHAKHQAMREARYTIKNSSDRKKQVLVERPVDPAWSIAEPKATEKTRSLYRFSVDAEPGKPARLAVLEEQPVLEEYVLSTVDPTVFNFYLHTRVASPAMKKALQDALDRKSAVAEAQAKRRAVEQQIAEIVAEQERIRRNLQGLSDAGSKDPFGEPVKKPTSEIMQRFLAKFSTLETDLEKQRVDLKLRKDNEAETVRQWEAFAESIVAE